MAEPPVPFANGRNLKATASPQQLSDFSDDLLLEILLRIRCPADLTRASAACVAFRRLVTDPAFLRRYRSYHAPPLLGFLNTETPPLGFHPVQAPHPNARVARAVPNISFDHLPPPKVDLWYIADARDGRVLIECSDCVTAVPDFVVCDPYSGRYLMLPPVPTYERDDDDLIVVFGSFAPCEDNKDETSFRVVCTMTYFTEFVILYFDSGCGSWTFGASTRFDSLGLPNGVWVLYPYDAYGCFYWKIDDSNILLKFDISGMELSTVVLPPNHEWRLVVVVEVGEGILGMFSYIWSDNFFIFYHYNDQIADEWQMKETIPLPVVHVDSWGFRARQGYIFVKDHLCSYYLLDTKTLKFQSAIQMNSANYAGGPPYFGFPPSMSPRLI